MECIPADHWTLFTFIVDKCLFITCAAPTPPKKQPMLYLTWSCVDWKGHKLDFCPSTRPLCSGSTLWSWIWKVLTLMVSVKLQQILQRTESQANAPPHPKRRKEPTKSSCIWFARTGLGFIFFCRKNRSDYSMLKMSPSVSLFSKNNNKKIPFHKFNHQKASASLVKEWEATVPDCSKKKTPKTWQKSLRKKLLWVMKKKKGCC